MKSGQLFFGQPNNITVAKPINNDLKLGFLQDLYLLF
jgi:hypothetical protein